jgi:hypothetical protein
VDKANGEDIMSASNEVRSVPIRKGNAPYSSVTGFHALPYRNLIPRCLIEGIEVIVRVIKMDINIIIKMIPVNPRLFWKIFSKRRTLCSFLSSLLFIVLFF